MMTPDRRWESTGITEEFLNERAEWMSRDPGFRGIMIMYFRTAGFLLRQSWFEYTLISAAFFHTVVGLEATLRSVHTDNADMSFKSLLSRAATNGEISDTTFSKIDMFPDEFSDLIGKHRAPYAEKLADSLPKLRNDYLHGSYRLSPAFLPVAIHVREAADAVWTRAIHCSPPSVL